MKKPDKFPLAASGWVYLGRPSFWRAWPRPWMYGSWPRRCGSPPLFVLYFFRDPPRQADASPEAVISPADGKVVAVEEVEMDKLPGGKGIVVSVFMNLFDVHVNRAPISGRVEAVAHYPGGFKSADLPQARVENERQEVC